MNRKPLTPANLKAFGLVVREGESDDTVQVTSVFVPVEIEIHAWERVVIPAGKPFAVKRFQFLHYPAPMDSGRRPTECTLFTEGSLRS